MDVADPSSPFPSCSFPCGGGGKKKKSKRGGSTRNYAHIQGEEEEDSTDGLTPKEQAGVVAKKHALLWRMWRVTKPLVISQGLWQLVATLTEFVPSIAMQHIIDFVSEYDKEGGKVTGRITLFVVLLFVGPILQGIADGRNFHLGRRIGCRVGGIVGVVGGDEPDRTGQ